MVFTWESMLTLNNLFMSVNGKYEEICMLLEGRLRNHNLCSKSIFQKSKYFFTFYNYVNVLCYTYFICLTIVLLPDSPAPVNKNTN